MELFLPPYCSDISIRRRESIVSAIKNDVLAPQLKSLNCALWYSTRAHCATRRARLLMPVLVKDGC